ncbi:T9SS type A sorting domain-containing protein [Salinimicrobium catena]|uniref:T9SS type A sorting domain-containing protein n=1 Tax=Salinimicrobium catena TaxID=390640 RepID=UPI002FE4E299
MKNRIYFTFPVLIFAVVFCYYQITDHGSARISDIRKKHSEFLKKKTPKKDSGLSRLEKIQEGIPPNAYYELMEYLTMNPALGYPEPYKVRELHEKLKKQRKKEKSYTKAPGETADNSWRSRGPTNVGGRTRVLLFDPNDPDAKRVFAGAISGGLWVNNDITRETSAWQQVSGLPANLNISCITVDPRDSNIWYVGTGEQYTAGDVMGTGVYKTTDGGASWAQVLDVKKFSTPGSGENAKVVGGLHYINDIQTWDNGNETEVYIGVSTHIYANARNPYNFMGFYDRGLYRSLDGGSNWERILQDDSFNDFEIDVNGNLWVATTESPGQSGSRGGKIFKKEKGADTQFTLINTIPGVLRTEIEASQIDPDKFYILAETANTEEADIWITTDAFTTLNRLPEPADIDYEGISPNDFARGQAFYNLMVESDPNDDNIVYVGGINLFRSTDSGTSWQQISKWNKEGLYKSSPISEVHADHHVMQFRPGNSNQAIFGHDGGVSFARDLSVAANNDVFISSQRDYITTQFYSVAVAPRTFASGDYYLGGTQDNGTQLFQKQDHTSFGFLGGDGAHSFYDQVDTDYLIANLVYNDLIIAYDYSQKEVTLIANNEDQDGFFINPQALDSNLDKLYSNGPEGTLYRYDNLTDLKPVGDNLTDNDVVASRTSLSNSLLDASISALAVSPYQTNSSTVLLGLVNGKLVRLENAHGGAAEASWKNIGSSQFMGSISDIEFGSTEAEIYVTFYNYGVKSVWYTKNALDTNPTWVSKEGDLPDLPVLAILPNPVNSQEVILGTELGIWFSDNFDSDRPSWKQAYNGMSDVKVTDLDLKKGTNEVYAASYGRGIFSGQFTTSPSEGGGITDGKIAVYPTVSNGTFNLLTANGSGPAEVYVYDLQGQLVQVSRFQLMSNIPEQVDLTKEASGIYFIQTQFSGNRQVEKVIRK